MGRIFPKSLIAQVAKSGGQICQVLYRLLSALASTYFILGPVVTARKLHACNLRAVVHVVGRRYDRIPDPCPHSRSRTRAHALRLSFAIAFRFHRVSLRRRRSRHESFYIAQTHQNITQTFMFPPAANYITARMVTIWV